MAADAELLERRSASERRTQAERRSEAERALLQAAVSIVAKDGLERFTLADVGEAAGYSRGLPAHYFGNKERFVGALAVHIVRNFGRSLARVEKHPAGLERLLGLCSYYFDSAQKDPKSTRALFAVLGEAITNTKLARTIADLNDRSVASIADNIRAASASGQIRKGINARATARLVLSGLRGAVGQWLMDPDGIDLRSLRSEFLSGLKRSLAA